MSLREEIAILLNEQDMIIHLNGGNYDYIKDAEIIINKVLDAAVEACEQTLMYDEDDPCRTFIEAIQRLKEGK